MYLTFQCMQLICLFSYIDETGADRRNLLRKHGYSQRGRSPKDHSLLIRGERLSAIACMSVNGIVDVKVVTGTSNGVTFYDFYIVIYCLNF